MSKLESIAVAVGLAVLFPVANALMTLDEASLDDPWAWARSLVIGVAGAVGAVLLGYSRRPKS